MTGKTMLRPINVTLLSALVLLTLSGCEKAPSTDPVVSTTAKWFVVTEMRKSKYIKASFREEGTAFQFKGLYIPKPCVARHSLKLGARVSLVEVVRQGVNGPYSELQGLKYEECSQ